MGTLHATFKLYWDCKCQIDASESSAKVHQMSMHQSAFYAMLFLCKKFQRTHLRKNINSAIWKNVRCFGLSKQVKLRQMEKFIASIKEGVKHSPVFVLAFENLIMFQWLIHISIYRTGFSSFMISIFIFCIKRPGSLQEPGP